MYHVCQNHIISSAMKLPIFFLHYIMSLAWNAKIMDTCDSGYACTRVIYSRVDS